MEAGRRIGPCSAICVIVFALLALSIGSPTCAFLIPSSPIVFPKFACRVKKGCSSLRLSAETIPVRARWSDAEVDSKRSSVKDIAVVESAGQKRTPLVPGSAGILERAIKKPPGTICVIGCIKRKDPAVSGIISEFKDAGEVAAAFHDAKVSAIGCWIDESLYGCTLDDLKKAVSSQQKFRGSFPGPCPVIALDIFLEPSQLAQVSSAGASAVLLSASILGSAKLNSMINAAANTGLESVVLCESEAEISLAADAGARIVAIDTRRTSVDAAIALASAAAAPLAGRVLIAFGGLSEIHDIWRLRGAGFQAAALGETLVTAAYGRPGGEVRQGGGKEGLGSSVLRGDTVRQNDLNALVRGATAKASAKFGPTSAEAFREKGAKFKRHYEV